MWASLYLGEGIGTMLLELFSFLSHDTIYSIARVVYIVALIGMIVIFFILVIRMVKRVYNWTKQWIKMRQGKSKRKEVQITTHPITTYEDLIPRISTLLYNINALIVGLRSNMEDKEDAKKTKQKKTKQTKSGTKGKKATT